MLRRFRNVNLLMCIAELLVGILLLIDPAGFTGAIITLLGVLLIVKGAVDIAHYFQINQRVAAEGHLLTSGLLFASAGLFCVIRSDWFIRVFPILTMFYGILILLSAFQKIQWTVDLRRMGVSRWYIALISAVCSLVLAVIVLTNLVATTAAMWMLIGIALIVEAALDILALLFQRGL